VKSLFNKVSRN